jgi:nuclear pore complex protein Nup93
LDEKVDLDWEEQRRRIFQHFGLGQKDDTASDGRGSFGRSMKQSKLPGATPSHIASGVSHRSVFGRSGLEKSVIGAPSTGTASHQFFEDPMERSGTSGAQSPDLRFLREKMGRYADKVQSLNSARLQARTFPILYEFSEVERHVGGDVSCIN